MLVCDIYYQLHFFIFLKDIKHILPGINNQIKSNVTTLYWLFYMQVQDGKIVKSYWFSNIKLLAHLFYNKAYKYYKVKAITRIVAKTNIAILTI